MDVYTIYTIYIFAVPANHNGGYFLSYSMYYLRHTLVNGIKVAGVFSKTHSSPCRYLF